MNIGLNIRRRRLELNITQEELSKDLMNRCVLNRIELGKAKPSVEQLRLLAARLDADVNCFIDSPKDQELKQGTSNSDRTNILASFLSGMNYVEIGEDELGFPCLQSFCKLFEKLPTEKKPTYVVEYATAKSNIARILFSRKQLGEIEKSLYQAKFQLIKCGMTNHEVFLSINQNLINYYNFSKQASKSIHIAESLLTPETKIIHKTITAAIHQSASVAYYDLGNFEKAHQHINFAILIYTYSGNAKQVGLCSINRFNLFREEGDFDGAIRFIEATQSQYSKTDPVFHILGLQIPMAYLNKEEYDTAEFYLQSINFSKLRQMDRDTYSFMKGILHYQNGEYRKALERFAYCEPGFEFNKYFYDLNFMNSIKKDISGDEAFLAINKSYPYSETTVNVYLRKPH